MTARQAIRFTADYAPEVDARIALVYGHWRGLTADGRPARRSAIEPAAFAAALGQVWLYRFEAAANTFICTLAGDEINRVWRRSIIGCSMEQLYEAPQRALIIERWTRLMREPAIGHGILPPDLRTGSRPEHVPAERLVLPLLGDDGAPYGVLGATIYQYDPLRDLDLPPPAPLAHHRIIPMAALV